MLNDCELIFISALASHITNGKITNPAIISVIKNILKNGTETKQVIQEIVDERSLYWLKG